MFEPLAPLAGLIVGTLVGMTGIGSGSLMAPLLLLVFGRSPLTAVGTDLAYSAVTKLVGAREHLQLGTVDRRVALWLAVGSVPAALVGIAGARLLEDVDVQMANALTGRLLGGVLVLVGAIVLCEPFIGPRLRSRGDLGRGGAVGFGALTGVLVGLTSLGSGALLAPILVLRTRLPYRTVVGTDIAHAAILTSASALAHLISGHVDGGLVVGLLIGSVPGIIIGSRLGAHLSRGAFRTILGAVIVLAGARLVL